MIVLVKRLDVPVMQPDGDTDTRRRVGLLAAARDGRRTLHRPWVTATSDAATAALSRPEPE